MERETKKKKKKKDKSIFSLVPKAVSRNERMHITDISFILTKEISQTSALTQLTTGYLFVFQDVLFQKSQVHEQIRVFF